MRVECTDRVQRRTRVRRRTAGGARTSECTAALTFRLIVGGAAHMVQVAVDRLADKPEGQARAAHKEADQEHLARGGWFFNGRDERVAVDDKAFSVFAFH